jgi:hypothetical protein
MADKVKLPTKKGIAELPQWARVAFAARCARRVLPLFKHFWKDAPQKHVVAVTRAVELAERSAAEAKYNDPGRANFASADTEAAYAASLLPTQATQSPQPPPTPPKPTQPQPQPTQPKQPLTTKRMQLSWQISELFAKQREKETGLTTLPSHPPRR